MKKKKVKITKQDEKLLMYPPNKGSWICDHCEAIVQDNKERCPSCLTNKPENPHTIYPLYLKACEKVGIEPNSCRWKYRESTKIPIVFPKNGVRWITQEEWQSET